MEQQRKTWYSHSYHNLFSLRLVFSIIPHVPKFLQPLIACVTANIFFVLLPKERRAITRNLRRICGGNRLTLGWRAYRVFYSFCDFIVSYCFVPRANAVRLRAMLAEGSMGDEKISRSLEEGNGVIMWTAHLGNWEFASRLLERHGRPVHIARMIETDNPAEMTLRNLMTNELLRPVDVTDRFAPLRLMHALRSNEIVAMQGDRVHQDSAAEVLFFGKHARFPLGPFILAHVSGAPVLPAVAVREKWLTYRLIVGDPIPVPQTGDREEAVRAGLRLAISFLEQNVREYPTQWLNFFDFWDED